MGDIQFIFEKPQKSARTVKKRTRLITSCDACRLKKIKCRPTGHGDDKCESCESTGSACVFNERNRIRSQRGIANFTVAPTRHNRKAVALRTAPSALTSVSVIVPSVNGESSSSSSSPATSSSPPSSRRKSTPNSLTSGTDSASNEINPEQSNSFDDPQRSPNISSSDGYSLFDPHRQGYPHPRLLPHLVDLFLLYAGSLFPFFDPDETARSALEGTLSPLMANCIAAYAARFSDELRHVPGSRFLTGEPYVETAKYLLVDHVHTKLERLHATILVAWIENGSGRKNSFYAYSQMAISQAAELRLSSEDYICQDATEEGRSRARQTFWSVVWLEIISCTVNGKCCNVRLEECSTGMPYPEVKSCGTLSRTTLYRAFKGIMSMMVSLVLISNTAPPSAPSPHRDVGIRQIQAAITTFKERLPPSLAFSTENLSFSTLFRESFAFYLVHVLMHCFLVISNCPSLFWRSQPPKTITEMPRLDIAWSSAISIVDILILMRNENVTFATGLSSTFLPISIARGALMLAQADAKGAIGATDMSIEEFELTNSFYLNETVEMLKNLSKFWANMTHVEVSSEAVALCGIKTESQVSRSVPSPRSLSLHLARPQILPPGGTFNHLPDGSQELEADERIPRAVEK